MGVVPVPHLDKNLLWRGCQEKDENTRNCSFWKGFVPVCLRAILPYSVNSCRCCKKGIENRTKDLKTPADGLLWPRAAHCRRARRRSSCSAQTPSCSLWRSFCSRRFPEKWRKALSKRDGSRTNLSVHEENGQLLSISLHYEGLESVGVEMLFQREGKIEQNEANPSKTWGEIWMPLVCLAIPPRHENPAPVPGATLWTCSALLVKVRKKQAHTIWSRRKDLPVRIAPATERTQAGRSATLGSQKTSLTSKLSNKYQVLERECGRMWITKANLTENWDANVLPNKDLPQRGEIQLKSSTFLRLLPQHLDKEFCFDKERWGFRKIQTQKLLKLPSVHAHGIDELDWVGQGPDAGRPGTAADRVEGSPSTSSSPRLL